MDEVVDAIVLALRRERERRQWSQRQVAAAMGRKGDHSSISDWEMGRYQPRSDSLARWAGVLGYDLTLSPKES
jgi:transcriptional regulator with XRE-family HTH domain